MSSVSLAARRGLHLVPRFRGEVVLLVAAVAALSYLTIIPLAMLVLGAFSRGGSLLDFRFTTQWLERVLTDETSVELLFNSVVYALGSAVVAFSVGTAVASAVERTNV